MDDLDLMGEIGPNLRLILDRQPYRSRLEIELALRGAFTLDRDGPEYQGINFAPEIAYRRLDLLTKGSFLRVGFGPVFGTDGIMDYFYNVRPEDARQGRPEHEAEAGYLGSRLQGSFELPVTGRLSLTLGAASTASGVRPTTTARCSSATTTCPSRAVSRCRCTSPKRGPGRGRTRWTRHPHPSPLP
jgi:hypothetical protein